MNDSKKTVKLKDLLSVKHQVDISNTEQFEVRPLTFEEMLKLFVDESENFMALYSRGLEGNTTLASLSPFLVAAPGLVAKIIALASDEPEEADHIRLKMSGTVQLIALGEIWKLSVPDPKKAQELLSGVMALAQKLTKEGKVIESEQAQPQASLKTTA